MYLSDSTLHSAIDGISRTLGIYVEVEGAEYAPASIIRLEWENECIDGSNFTIGGTLSNRIELEIYHDESILVGDQIKPSVEIEVEGEMIRIPLGIFYVDSVSVNKEITTLTAYDAMISLDKEYIPSANHTSLRALASDVCQQAGILMKGDIEDIPIARSLEGYSYRETLGFIASFHAGNMVVDRDGQFKIKTYEVVDRTIPNHAYFSFDQKDTYRVSAVMCNFGSIGIGRGDDTAQCVTFENPYVTEEHIDRIYLKLKDLTFVAGTLKYRGDMNLDAGDLFTLTDANGQDHLLLCGQNQLTFTGGLTGTLNSIGEGQGANQYVEYKFKNKKSITQLTVEMGKIQAEVSGVEKKLENDYSTTEETKSLVTQTATEISSTVSKKEIQNVQVGGTNLLTGTKTLTGASLSGQIVDDKHKGCNIIHEDNNNGSGYKDVIAYSGLTLEPSTEYTLSFWAQGRQFITSYLYPDAVEFGYHHNFENRTTNMADGSINTDLEERTWKRYAITWKTRSDVSGTKNIIVGRIHGGVHNGCCYISAPKFEKGNKPTDWNESPLEYSTTTEMNSAIQQKADSITSTVSAYRTGVANLLLNSSEGKQLNNPSSGYHEMSYGVIEDLVYTIFHQPRTFCLSFTVGYTGSFATAPFDTVFFDRSRVLRWTTNDIQKIERVGDNAYRYYMKPLTCGVGFEVSSVLRFIGEYGNGNGWFYDVMLTEGELHPSAYTPSNRDYSNKFSEIKQTTDSITSSVSNIQNGLTNENLLVGSFDYTPTTYWYQPSNTAISSSQILYDCKAWRTEVDWGGIKVNLKYLLDRGVFEVGKPCTFSMYARTTSGTCKMGAYMHHWYQGDYVVTTQWKQFSFTFTPNQSWIDEITDTNTMRFEPYELSGKGIRFYGACYKLERGTIATPWATNSSDVSLIKQQADSITSTVSSNYTTLNNKFGNYPTTTEMNSAIQQKADSITSTVNMTKMAGIELLPQGYIRNSKSGYHVRTGGDFYVNQWGLFTGSASWVSTDFIAIDPQLPLEYFYYMQNTGGYDPLTYLGFEQYDWNKQEIGVNAATIYVVNEKFTGYKYKRDIIPENSFDPNTKYIKLRWLTNWDDSGVQESYMHQISLKQLQNMNASTQIAQMADKIETKVDVNGVKSTIQQNPESVRIGFNAISDYFDLNSTRLKVGHSDGSYTRIGQDGILYYDAYANWKYHSLMYQGWLGAIEGTSWSRTITLPNSFRGKVFSVIVTVNMVNPVNTHDVVKHYQVTVPHNTVNYNNGTFVINMSALAYWVPGQGHATAIQTDVSWIAIA